MVQLDFAADTGAEALKTKPYEAGFSQQRSAQLVRGHWWLVASVTLIVTGGGLLLADLPPNSTCASTRSSRRRKPPLPRCCPQKL